MKAYIHWSQVFRLEIDKDVGFIDEDFLFDVPEDLVNEYDELRKKSKELQEKLQAIYKTKNI